MARGWPRGKARTWSPCRQKVPPHLHFSVSGVRGYKQPSPSYSAWCALHERFRFYYCALPVSLCSNSHRIVELLSTIGIALRGIQACQSLLSYHGAWKTYDTDTSSTYSAIDDLMQSFVTLNNKSLLASEGFDHMLMWLISM